MIGSGLLVEADPDSDCCTQAFAAGSEEKGADDPHFEGYTPWTGQQEGATHEKVVPRFSCSAGRPRRSQQPSAWGMLWPGAIQGSAFILSGWFGLTGNHANVWPRFGSRMLLEVLWKVKEARVTMPDSNKIEQSK